MNDEDYILQNWDKISPETQNLLKVIGVSPDSQNNYNKSQI